MGNAPKQWTIKVISPANGPLQVLRGEAALLGLPVGADGVTPVELLLVAAATCLAISCHSAFALKQLARVDFEVSATGRKAAGLPSRLAGIDLRMGFGTALAEPDAQALAALAKQMCTVTNTVAAVPPCTVEVAVGGGPAPAC